MDKLFYYGFLVKWSDGSREMFKYDTKEQAEAAYRYQDLENWRSNRYVYWVGKRLNWSYLFRLRWLRKWL